MHCVSFSDITLKCTLNARQRSLRDRDVVVARILRIRLNLVKIVRVQAKQQRRVKYNRAGFVIFQMPVVSAWVNPLTGTSLLGSQSRMLITSSFRCRRLFTGTGYGSSWFFEKGTVA